MTIARGAAGSPFLRRGVTLSEVVTIAVLVALTTLILASAMLRQREGARSLSCNVNLMRIGEALAKHAQSTGRLPSVKLDGGEGPLAALLDELGLPGASGRIPGFACPSDPRALGDLHPAPTSYRATTGDATSGGSGIFAPGREVTLAEVEAGDGASYTAAFAERLVGDGGDSPNPWNYAEVAGQIAPEGCPEPPAGSWRGDAGSSWLKADWKGTLYSHAPPPNERHSCVASDGKSAWMGASSGHVGEIHVLKLDGHVDIVAPTIDREVWKRMATISDRARNDEAAARP